MIEAKKNAHVNGLKNISPLRKEFSFAHELLKCSLAKGVKSK